MFSKAVAVAPIVREPIAKAFVIMVSIAIVARIESALVATIASSPSG